MTIHPDMYDMQYDLPLVWYGTWEVPKGLNLRGFHVWSRRGRWVGVYRTKSRADREAVLLTP